MSRIILVPTVRRRPRIPRATYRLQFNEHFRLPDALALVPYLQELGVSHIYASPLFQARPHSVHGYDVCDYNRLNPEIGTETDLEKLANELHRHDMGLVLDIVPNHMGIGGPENRWWWDVLALGKRSRYAGHFDIDWNPPDPLLRGKVLAPVLGDHYDHVLAKGELQIQQTNVGFVLRYHGNQFPVAPGSVRKNSPARLSAPNPPALDRLIERQHYRLASWQEADARLNYRRFFAVSTLAAVRVEDKRVFNETHALLRRWFKQGWLDGLRVDHPDGLRDPGRYLQRLRAAFPGAWIVVEKILMPGERLPVAWPVAGTTGYDFLNEAAGVLIDASNEKVLTDFYSGFTGQSGDHAALAREKKRMVLNKLLAAEVCRLTGLLARIAARHKRTRHFTGEELRETLVEMAAAFTVYRTYIRPNHGPLREEDGTVIDLAILLASRARPDLRPELFEFVRSLLRQQRHGKLGSDFVCRFQQLTGPAMAKGVEDTAFYCFNRLTSLNEVGGDPGRFGVNVEAFHEFCRHARRHRPDSMLTTSTHDTKRSEDVRARISLLSEIPESWGCAVQRWSAMNACHRRGEWPDRNAEYLFYQTLVGAWPLPADRAIAYMEKATCEAQEHTGWNERNAKYDEALRNFISESLCDPEFIADLECFVAGLTVAGRVNSLVQTLLKLTAPGVPDIYQGNELWDFSLVDPDNRRPVDFKACHRMLAMAKTVTAAEAWKHSDERLPKLWLTRQVLVLRARRPEPFDSRGSYTPLYARGPKAKQVVAFMRGDFAITIVPRLLLKLQNDWADTKLDLPRGDWVNELGGGNIVENPVPLAAILEQFPVALLVRKEDG